MRMTREEKERRNIYYIGWLLLLIGMAYAIFSYYTGHAFRFMNLPCLFHALTGGYCPGCGGTRAVKLLLRGQFLQSFYYHPLVLYGAILYLWFMITNTAEIIIGRELGMKYRHWYVIVGIMILAINFIIKNGALLIWHYPMIL